MEQYRINIQLFPAVIEYGCSEVDVILPVVRRSLIGLSDIDYYVTAYLDIVVWGCGILVAL